MSRALFALALALFVLAVAANNATDKAKIPLHLLTLVPLSEGPPDASLLCVNRGEELLPAAELAAELANKNILQDFQLHIVPVNTAKCSEDSFSLTLANFVQKLTNSSYSVIGVVGMMCSSAVLSVSPLASHDGINILQITSGTVSPNSISLARERVTVDKLYQTAPPSTDFNDELIALLNKNNVSQLAVIRHVGTFFIEHDIIATDLRQKAMDGQLNIRDFEIEIDNEEFANRTLETIETDNSGIRVIYATVTIEEARLLLCLAVKRNVKIIYPRNQWIFHTHSYQELVQPPASNNCTSKEMEKALEGVVLLQHPDRAMKNSFDVLSHTNFTYNEYLKAYRRKLSGNNSVCDRIPGVIHTNALFDSVMAFALAINNSQEVEDLINFGVRNSTDNVAEMLQHELNSQSFLGASGFVQFDNVTHEVVRDNKVVVIVVNNSMEIEVPSFKEFPSVTQQIPLALPIVTIILVFLLVCVHTITFLLFIYYWNDPDIKATSPVLSVIIFIACYMLDLSLLLTALRYSFASEMEFVVFCAAENWLLYIGIQLIFSTLMMRLIRVYRIFFHYSKLGKAWSDYGLILFISLFVSIGVVILTLWMIVDTPFLLKELTFVSATDSPFYSILLICQSKYYPEFPIWIVFLLIYTGIMMVSVLLLAIRTRKVKIESFKDTRTVNIFIYTTIICFIFLIILSLIFDALRDQVVVFIARILALGSVAIACACFLFLPKIYSAQCERKNPHRKKSLTSSYIATNKSMTTAF